MRKTGSNSLEDDVPNVGETYCRVVTILDRTGTQDGQGQSAAMPGV